MLVIASAIIRRGHNLCLVEQQGPHDSRPSWMLPGGRVEDGEEVLTGLAREVKEETGLRVVGTPLLAFELKMSHDGEVYTALTFLCEAAGGIEPADPDQVVRRVEWVSPEEALERLALVDWYDVAPLRRYLDPISN